MAKQREVMREIWNRARPNGERAAQLYGEAERDGAVARGSNTAGIGSIDYARSLLRDGLAKGWLDDSQTSLSASGHAASASYPATATRSIPNPAPTPPREPEAYLQAVRAWREAFRPQRVRVLLLAESHVASRPGDERISVRLPPHHQTSAPDLPAAFCRLVYCLGYGESEICSSAPAANGGTWQYWDLFGAVAGAIDDRFGPAMPRRHASSLDSRLEWKLQALAILRRSGVWLEDACRTAVYSSTEGRVLAGRAYRDRLRRDVADAVWPGVAGDRPDRVWIVGRGVGDALSGLPMLAGARVISQPQDRDAGRFRADLEELVRAMRQLRSGV